MRVAELDAWTARLPSSFRSQRAKVASPPLAGGFVKAAAPADQDFGASGRVEVGTVRMPPPAKLPAIGVKLGETAKPPPETCVLPLQPAMADAAPPDASGTVEVTVVAGFGFRFFFARAG
jgi:hypothetical protein